MKFSIIGTGFIFPAHVQAIRDAGGEIRDIVNDVHGQDIWKSIVKNTDADCIVILTPNDLHFDMAMFSAGNDKIVLCEKPLVIKSEHAKVLAEKPNIFTVLQLKYHPLVEEIRKAISGRQKNEIEMSIFFKRGEDYANGWKGDKKRSGGFLFNLGIHYFDLLLYLFGDVKKIETKMIKEKIVNGLTDAEARGTIEGENYICNWIIGINKKNNGEIIKKREFIINGEFYNFSSKDSLAEENLHKFVYQDLLVKKGITPLEALKSIELIERLYDSYKK
jgi:UDP-N-acetyl-2-amino-2-deoxyglucuronate dehydrogenase